MKTITLGASNNHCKHCNKRLHWRAHKEITAKQLKQAFYYSKWEHCSNGCGAVWFDPTFIVWNNNDKAPFVRGQQEISEQMSFLRSIE